MTRAAGSEFQERQLDARATVLAPGRSTRVGEYVLYWMQSTQRFEENWALRFAVREADARGLPLLVYQGLDPTYEFASDRVHTFILEGARELAARAERLGLSYLFSLRERRRDDRRVVDRLAARAACVITDDYPTAGVRERTIRFAARTRAPVVAVDSVGIVPASYFPRAEYAARTVRPKILAALDSALEPIRDRPPRRAMPDRLLRSLELDPFDLVSADIPSTVARCEIDHAVPPISIHGGMSPARHRLRSFVRHSAATYDVDRREPSTNTSTNTSTSGLSPWLHFGMISSPEVVRAVIAAAPPPAARESFLNEIVVWRELALNLCHRTPRFRTMHALPSWARRTLAAHDADRREAKYSLAELERAETRDAIWNAAQRELIATGVIHNAVRQLWGKSVIRWTQRPSDVLRRLIHLNDRWAIDGRDPNSYANILWCLGKFDRPFAERRVWGTVRPMMLERARGKFNVDAYVARWNI